MYTDLGTAENAKMELVERLQDIDAQLASRKADVVGRVPDRQYKDYLAWKGRALAAKAKLTFKLKKTKLWIGDNRPTDRRVDNALV